MADPTALYSYQGQEPQSLPHKIRLSDGRSRTDVSSFTDEEIADAGFTGPYTTPDFDQEYQRVSWNSENLAFVVEDISDGELWQRIRDKRDLLLKNSDWTMMPDAPSSLNYREWEKYRQALRDLPNDFANPKEVIWPESPEGKSDDEFDDPRVYEDCAIWRIRDMEKNVYKLIYRVYQPYPSWSWDEIEEKWKAPVTRPDYDEQTHGCSWDEDNQQWIIVPLVEEV